MDDLNGFVHEHALYVLLGIIGLLAILLAWVLSGGLRRRFPQQAGRVPPVIIGSPPASLPPPRMTGIHFRRHTITGGKIIVSPTNGRIDSSGEAILAACFLSGKSLAQAVVVKVEAKVERAHYLTPGEPRTVQSKRGARRLFQVAVASLAFGAAVLLRPRFLAALSFLSLIFTRMRSLALFIHLASFFFAQSRPPEEFNRPRRRIAQRFEQTVADQNRNMVWFKAKPEGVSAALMRPGVRPGW